MFPDVFICFWLQHGITYSGVIKILQQQSLVGWNKTITYSGITAILQQQSLVGWNKTITYSDVIEILQQQPLMDWNKTISKIFDPSYTVNNLRCNKFYRSANETYRSGAVFEMANHRFQRSQIVLATTKKI